MTTDWWRMREAFSLESHTGLSSTTSPRQFCTTQPRYMEIFQGTLMQHLCNKTSSNGLPQQFIWFSYSCGKARMFKLDEGQLISNITLVCGWDKKWHWSLNQEQLPTCEWVACYSPPHPPQRSGITLELSCIMWGSNLQNSPESVWLAGWPNPVWGQSKFCLWQEYILWGWGDDLFGVHMSGWCQRRPLWCSW